VILLITPVITAVAFTLALGLGLLAVSPPVGVVTLAGGILALVALRAGTALEARAQRAYTAATEELDDRLFEFAWAQPSLRTARNLSLGNRLVNDAIGKTRGRVLKLLLWQIPGEFLFSLVLQVVLFGFGCTAWLALDSGVIDAITAATLIIVLLRVLEQVTTVAGTVAGVVAINRNLQEVRAIDVLLHPVSLNVARVFGDPPINLLRATLVDHSVQIEQGPAMALMAPLNVEDPALLVGIRPEDLRLAGTAGDLAFPARVERVECGLAGTRIECRARVGALTALVPSLLRPALGETVVLHADPGALYLFDGAGALVQQVERAAERAQRRPQVVPVPPDMPVTEAAPTIFALR